MTTFICEDPMGSNQKKLYWILISIFLFVSLNNSFISCIEYTKETNLKTSISSGRIHIDYNYDWTDLKNDGLCTGSGTSLDPYIIENLEIDGQGYGSCIHIDNSNIYFVIQNCELFNADEAIMLQNVQNGEISFNTIYSNNQAGVFLDPNSAHNDISYNSIYNSHFGLEFLRSGYNFILSNEIFDNSIGIYLYQNSEHNSIQGCDIYDNTDYGIFLYESYFNFINVNTLSNHVIGISLSYSDNNRINSNTANFCEDGIILDHSNNNQVTWNTMNNNGNGLCLYVASFNQITQNNMRFNDIGIVIGEQSKCNTISENNFDGNIINIYGEQEECMEYIILFSFGIILGISAILVTVILIRRRRSGSQGRVLEKEEIGIEKEVFRTDKVYIEEAVLKEEGFVREVVIEEKLMISEVLNEEEVPLLQEVEIKEEITEKIKITATSNIICPFCGFKSPNDASYCVQCGQSIRR